MGTANNKPKIFIREIGAFGRTTYRAESKYSRGFAWMMYNDSEERWEIARVGSPAVLRVASSLSEARRKLRREATLFRDELWESGSL